LGHPVDELFGFYVPGMEVDVKKNEYLFYRLLYLAEMKHKEFLHPGKVTLISA